MARIDLPHKEDLSEDYQYLLDSDVLGQLELLRAIGSNPRILQTYMRHGSALWKETGLPPRRVELVILAVARALDCKYEWHQHVRLARDVSITGTEIRAIGARQTFTFDDVDTALLRYVWQAAVRDVDDDVHQRVEAQFDDEVIAGIATLVGHYLGTAAVVDALDLQPETSFVSWSPNDERIATYDRLAE